MSKYCTNCDRIVETIYDNICPVCNHVAWADREQATERRRAFFALILAYGYPIEKAREFWKSKHNRYHWTHGDLLQAIMLLEDFLDMK